MKTLKALLLVFVISFTINEVNAQGNTSPDCPQLSMELDPTVMPGGQACFIVTVTNSTPKFLIIKPEEKRGWQSATQVTSFSATVCTDRPDDIAIDFYIECGVDDSDGNALCREGCTVLIEP